MNYFFERLVANNFRVDGEGNLLFVPWSKRGNSYIVSTDQEKSDLQFALTRYYKWTLFAIIFFSLIGQGLFFFGGGDEIFPFLTPVKTKVLLASIPGIISIFWYRAWVKRAVKELPLSNQKLTWKESLWDTAHSHGLDTLWILEILNVIAVLIGMWMLIDDELVLGLITTSFFLYGGIIVGYMLYLREKERKQNPTGN